MRRKLLGLALSCTGITIAVPGQSTWTVDVGGGAQFADIPPAIAAASPGDTILVAPGIYSAFVLDKGLQLLGSVGTAVPRIEVLGVPAGQTARVASIEVTVASAEQVHLGGNLGKVVLVDVLAPGLPSSYSSGPGGPGLHVHDCALVQVQRGSFRGQSSGSDGAPGALIENSTVSLLDATFQGGVTAPPFASSANDGLAGISVVSSQVMLVGVAAAGGNASDGPYYGGDGGHGVAADAASAVLAVGDCALVGKDGGSAYFGGPAGNDGFGAQGGVRVKADASVVNGVGGGAQQIAARPVLEAPPGIVLGAAWTVDVHGAAGQLVVLGADVDFGYGSLAPWLDGPLLLDGNNLLLTPVVLDATGVAHWSLTLPNVAAAQRRDVFVQGFADLFSAPVATGLVVGRT